MWTKWYRPALPKTRRCGLSWAVRPMYGCRLSQPLLISGAVSQEQAMRAVKKSIIKDWRAISSNLCLFFCCSKRRNATYTWMIPLCLLILMKRRLLPAYFEGKRRIEALYGIMEWSKKSKDLVVSNLWDVKPSFYGRCQWFWLHLDLVSASRLPWFLLWILSVLYWFVSHLLWLILFMCIDFMGCCIDFSCFRWMGYLNILQLLIVSFCKWLHWDLCNMLEPSSHELT